MASLTTFLELIDLVLGEAAYGAYTDWGAVQDRDNSIIESAIKDIGGSVTAGGTANALTVTANVGFTTFQNGRYIGFVAAADNTTAATLNVNALGAKAIRKMTSGGESALTGSEIKAGSIVHVVYNSALNGGAGAWLMLNPSLAVFPTSSNDNRLVRTDGTAFGLQQSGITIDDSNNMSGIGTIASGAITSTNTITASSAFATTAGSALFGPTGSGNIALRPQGVGSAAGQFVVNNDGSITAASHIISSQSFIGNTGSVILAPVSAGTIFLRPTAFNSTTGQATINSAGAMTLSGGFSCDGIAGITSTGLHIWQTDYSMTDANAGLSLYTADPIINVGRVSGAALQVKRRTTDGAAVNFYKNESNVGTIAVTAAATAYNTSSDEGLKDFIGLYDPAKAIDIIRRDPVRDFLWNKASGAPGQYAVGWGAQTSYAVSPDLATPGHGKPGDEDFQWWGVDQGKRTPYLWAAMGNVLDRLEALEGRF
jgi:hypothetical protein